MKFALATVFYEVLLTTQTCMNKKGLPKSIKFRVTGVSMVIVILGYFGYFHIYLEEARMKTKIFTINCSAK